MSETEQSQEQIQNQFLAEHGVNRDVLEELGWEFRFIICPSINEKIEYTNSLQAEYGDRNVITEPLINKHYPDSGGVSGWAFFVKPKS
jgi:hypothetical protein